MAKKMNLKVTFYGIIGFVPNRRIDQEQYVRMRAVRLEPQAAGRRRGLFPSSSYLQGPLAGRGARSGDAPDYSLWVR